MAKFLQATALGAVLLLVGIRPGVADNPKIAPKKIADRAPVSGYRQQEINRFHFSISREVLQEDQKWTGPRKPLEVLRMETDMLSRALPPRAVKVLQSIPIWVEWNRAVGPQRLAVAMYHAGNKAGKPVLYVDLSVDNPGKMNSVEIVNAMALTAEHQGDRHRCVLLHEFTHAVHHHLFDFDNRVIKDAYAHAMAQKLYAGQYAATNEKEYFAEISCAYFDHLNYTPHTRDELKKYDPEGYRMMELTWGTPEQIETQQRPERERIARLKFSTGRDLLESKQRWQKGIDMLSTLVQDYPNTWGAEQARKLLERENVAVAPKPARQPMPAPAKGNAEPIPGKASAPRPQGNPGLPFGDVEKFGRLLRERLESRDPEALALVQGGQIRLTPERMRELTERWEKRKGNERKP